MRWRGGEGGGTLGLAIVSLLVDNHSVKSISEKKKIYYILYNNTKRKSLFSGEKSMNLTAAEVAGRMVGGRAVGWQAFVYGDPLRETGGGGGGVA